MPPRLPGWVTDDHEETHYVLSVITSHPSWESGGGWAALRLRQRLGPVVTLSPAFAASSSAATMWMT